MSMYSHQRRLRELVNGADLWTYAVFTPSLNVEEFGPDLVLLRLTVCISKLIPSRFHVSP